ncbi:hypothetical protein ASF94_04385 [Acidovorax sp. Leaf160]|nr:hypothetical protein ASF94_04385 [Acidovorax sp. Leaf160]
MQHALLASIKARLTQEVCGLVGALGEFGRRAQLVGEELSDRSHFGKSVTSLLALLAFQYAYSLSKGLDTPVFFDDAAEYLRELQLSLHDLVREVDLDGRRFLAVAFLEQGRAELLRSGEGGGER